MRKIKHCDRFKNSINREYFDRIPVSFYSTKEMLNNIADYLNKEKEEIIYNVFDIDRRFVLPKYIGSKPKKYEDGTYDNIFGVRMKDQDYGKGTYSESIINPLSEVDSIEKIKKYNWPVPDDYDYGSIIKPLEEFQDYAITVGYFAIGWYSWEMRGMSKFLEDLILNPKIAEAIINQISDLAYEYYARLIEKGKNYINKNFVAIHLADDWATQDSLLISPTFYRKFFKKHYKRIIDKAHSYGLKVEFHCCGSAVGLIPEFIDTGVDILNPIQTSAKGMEPHKLKKEYGKDLSFSGGIDVQTILPFGTVQRVKDEVKYLLDTMGKDGGYILEPSHAIQVGTPPENVEAMYLAVKEYYGQ